MKKQTVPEKKENIVKPRGTVFEEHFPFFLDIHQRPRQIQSFDNCCWAEDIFLFQTNIFYSKTISIKWRKLFWNKNIIPMITATSTVKTVSQGTAIAQPKWIWHTQCATEVGLALQCATQVNLAPSVRDWSRLGTPVRNSSRSDTTSALLTSVWSEPILVGIGWSEPILVWIVSSELARVAHLILGKRVFYFLDIFYFSTCHLVYSY